MKLLNLLAFAAALALPSLSPAESLRCDGGIASEGDSRLSLFYKCGQPNLVDTYCAPVYFPGSLHPVPASLAPALVPCQPVEQWLYERGPGNLLATVHIRAGVVQSIRYGRQPQ
jgi:hypothetical protein